MAPAQHTSVDPLHRTTAVASAAEYYVTNYQYMPEIGCLQVGVWYKHREMIFTLFVQ